MNENIDCMPNLRVIANHGAGYNQIDYNHAISKGIWVCNTPGVVGPATADVAILHMVTVLSDSF
jgi:D-3-phosphoglycerate dehydrogenase